MMDQVSRVRRRPKFRRPMLCPECANPEAATSGPSILDDIPEARALYCPHRAPALQRKRKLVESQDSTPNWKKYRDSRPVLEPVCSASSDDEDDEKNAVVNGTIVEENDVEDIYGKFPKFSPSKFYHTVVHQIDELMKDFRLTDDTYVHIMELLNQEMNKGLERESHPASTVKMFPTYVRAIPDGTESGEFLALDLGGTNFRVLHVKLQGQGAAEVKSHTFLIPKAIMLGSGANLFDHIATCIEKFVVSEKLNDRAWPLGFTFSFPCVQDGLASARLVRWTKGFRCSGVAGQDVVKLLHEALERKPGLQVECLCLVNDPVGALMATAHSDKNCLVGLILGTGTNACYMEALHKVGTWDGDQEEPLQVILNTEWGAFGDNGVLEFIRNEFDRQMDEVSLNPGHQLFEKMISGMYMGEIVRLVLCQLVDSGLLFGGEGSEELYTYGSFLTKYISEIESDDPEDNFENTKLVLQELDINHYTVDDCRHVQHVCWQVSQRAAFLAGTGLATIIRRLNKPEVTIGVDGSLYRFHPHFSDLMKKKISQLIPPGIQFKLVTSHDGSGKGAALVAAVAQRMRLCSQEEGVDDMENNNPGK